MAGQALKDLYEIVKNQGSNVVINAQNQLAGQMGEMLNQFETFLDMEALSLLDAVISEPDDNNNFSVTGLGNLLGFVDTKIKATFFTAHKITEEANEKIQCIIEVMDSIPTWDLSQNFPDIPEYLCVEDALEKFEESFLKKLNFTAPKLIFSTMDFLNEEANQLLVSLEENITCGEKVLKSGINFAAGLVAEAGTFWDTVTQVVEGLDILDVIGQVTTDAYGKLVLLVEQELEDKTFKITDDVALTLKKLHINGGLTPESLLKAVVVVDAELVQNEKSYPFTLELDLGRKVLVISSQFETGKVMAINDILKIVGLKEISLTDYLPEGSSVEYFSETGLLDMRFEIALSPMRITHLGFSFSTINPWNILDGRISIQPVFSWKIQYPFEISLRKIDIDILGKWNLGEGLMNIFAKLKTGEISARLLPGDMIDIGALIQGFLPNIHIPEISFGDLILNANYLTKSFYLSVESAGTWSFDVGFGKIDIYDAWLLIDYRGGEFKEFCIGGIVELADTLIEVQAEYTESKGWTLEGGIELLKSTSIGTMINGIMDGFADLLGTSISVNIPDSFLPIEAGSLYLKYQSNDNTFSAISDLKYSFSIGELFSSNEAAALLVLDDTGIKDGAIMVKFNLCGSDMELTVQKEADGDWSIDGGTVLDETMSIADLTNGLLDSLQDLTGLDLPNIPDSFLPVEAKNLYVKYQNKNKQLLISSDLDYSFSIGDFLSSDEAKLKFIFEGSSLENAYAAIKFTLLGMDMELVTEKMEGEGWQLSGGLVDGEKINISDIIEQFLQSGGLSLPVDLPDFSLDTVNFKVDLKEKNFYISVQSQDTWKVPLGITELEIGRIGGEFYYQDGKSSGVIKGVAELAGAEVEVSYDISQGLIIYGTIPDISTKPLTDFICGADVFDLVPLPDNIGSFEIEDISFMINIKQKDIWLKGNIGDLGDAIFVIKDLGSNWGFCIVVMLDTDFEFSSISSFLGFLDVIDLNNLSMVVSSYSGELSVTGIPQLTGNIQSGLNFMLTLDMNAIPELSFIYKLVRMKSSYLPLCCSIFKGGGVQIDGDLVRDIPLGCGVTIKRAALRMRVGETLPSYSMLLSVLLDIGDQLLFTGEATVSPTGAMFSATMEGMWSEPFGIKNVYISDVALALGFTTCPIPTIGVAGTVMIGKVYGEVGVLLNTINPYQSILHIKFNHLGVSTIFDLCNSSILEELPDYFDPIIETGFDDVEIHIVPQESFIGQIRYEEGFRAKGTLNLLGLEAFGEFDINQQTGSVFAQGYLSEVNLFDILKITGANGEPNANFMIDVGTMKIPKAHISGCIDFLGLQKYSIYADLSEKGFVFSIYEKLFGLVELQLDTYINKDLFYVGGRIQFGIKSLGPIKAFGVTIIDEIPINTGFEATADISVSKDGFSLGLSGNMEILGVTLFDVGFRLNVAPRDFMQLYDFVVDELVNAITDGFADIFSSVAVWARAVAEGVIEFAGDVADVCKNVFNSSMEAVLDAYEIIGKGIEEAVQGLKNFYGVAAETVGSLLKAAEYAIGEIAGVLKNVYELTNEGLTAVIKGIGYGIEEIGDAIAAACDLAADVVADAMDIAGYALEEIAASLNVVYSLADSAVATIIRGLGYGVEEVSKAITIAFELGANALAFALKKAGYFAQEVMQGVKAALEVVENVAAAALKFAGYAIDQIADGLRMIYGAVEDTVTQALKIAGFVAEQVAQVLKDLFNTSIEYAAQLLKNAGYVASQIAQGLKSAFDAAVNTVASILKGVGYLASEVGQALNTVYNAAASIVASALKAAGYAATYVAEALNTVYQLAAEGVASILKAAGYVAEEIMDGLKKAYNLAAKAVANILKTCGYAVSEIANALKNIYGSAAYAVAEILKGIGFAAVLVAEGLKNIYGLASDAAAQILKAIGYGISEITAAIKGAFNAVGEAVVEILKNLGYGLNEIGTAISNIFNMGVDAITDLLRCAGYGVEQVGEFLSDAFGYSCEAIQDVLTGVGYVAEEVGEFLEDVFDWVPYIDFPYIDFPHIDLPHWDSW